MTKKPTPNKMIPYQIKIPPELKKQLEQVAEEEGRTPSNLVRYLIKEYINS